MAQFVISFLPLSFKLSLSSICQNEGLYYPPQIPKGKLPSKKWPLKMEGRDREKRETYCRGRTAVEKMSKERVRFDSLKMLQADFSRLHLVATSFAPADIEYRIIGFMNPVIFLCTVPSRQTQRALRAKCQKSGAGGSLIGRLAVANLLVNVERYL